MAKPFDLVFKFRLHAQFIDVDLVEYFEKFGNKLLLADVLIFAISIPCSGAAVVNIVCGRAIAELLILVFRRDAGLAGRFI